MIADELSKLFDLLQKGAITQDEYLAQKQTDGQQTKRLDPTQQQ